MGPHLWDLAAPLASTTVFHADSTTLQAPFSTQQLVTEPGPVTPGPLKGSRQPGSEAASLAARPHPLGPITKPLGGLIFLICKMEARPGENRPRPSGPLEDEVSPSTRKRLAWSWPAAGVDSPVPAPGGAPLKGPPRDLIQAEDTLSSESGHSIFGRL